MLKNRISGVWYVIAKNVKTQINVDTVPTKKAKTIHFSWQTWPTKQPGDAFGDFLDSGWPPHAVADSSQTQMGTQMDSKAWHRPKAIENPGNKRATQNELNCYNQTLLVFHVLVINTIVLSITAINE